MFRHRFSVQNWLQASFRLAQVVGHHAARSGDAVRAELSTGEVVATVSNDALRAGGAFDILARLVGQHRLVHRRRGDPARDVGDARSHRPDRRPASDDLTQLRDQAAPRRQRVQRDEVGLLTALGADTAAGLRVLRGVGGEDVFFDRYQQRSESVRVAACASRRRSRRSTRRRCSCRGSSSSSSRGSARISPPRGRSPRAS